MLYSLIFETLIGLWAKFSKKKFCPFSVVTLHLIEKWQWVLCLFWQEKEEALIF